MPVAGLAGSGATRYCPAIESCVTGTVSHSVYRGCPASILRYSTCKNIFQENPICQPTPMRRVPRNRPTRSVGKLNRRFRVSSIKPMNARSMTFLILTAATAYSAATETRAKTVIPGAQGSDADLISVFQPLAKFYGATGPAPVRLGGSSKEPSSSKKETSLLKRSQSISFKPFEIFARLVQHTS